MLVPKAKKEDLANFVMNDIIPLKRSSYPLNAFGEYIRRELSGRDIFYIPEKFLKVVLGGVQDDGSYSPNSLAEFYSQYFGIGLPQTDRVRYINSIKNGMKSVGIAIKSDPDGKKIDSNYNNAFSMFHYISAIDNLCTKIINKSVRKGSISQSEAIASSSFKEDDGKMLIDNPSQVLSLIRDFYNLALKVLPTYNEYSIFLTSLHHVSRDYLVEAYPSISDKFNNIINDLDLEMRLITNLPITDKYIDYIFFKRDGIAFSIFNLYDNIFSLSTFLSSQSQTLFDGVNNEYSNFLINAKKSVAGILDTTASKLIESQRQEFPILLTENGFTEEYTEFPNQYISAFSKSISPLLFSKCAHLEVTNTRYATITIYNHMAQVLQ